MRFSVHGRIGLQPTDVASRVFQVVCEGYDYPDDEYILKGSCGLEYTLETTGAGRSDQSRQNNHGGGGGGGGYGSGYSSGNNGGGGYSSGGHSSGDYGQRTFRGGNNWFGVLLLVGVVRSRRVVHLPP